VEFGPLVRGCSNAFWELLEADILDFHKQARINFTVFNLSNISGNSVSIPPKVMYFNYKSVVTLQEF
jgi:hypothetical protein